MGHMKFDVNKIARLDDVGRFESLRPEVMWAALGAPAPAAIAEIGAGTGLFARRFASLAPDAVVYAIDTEQVMLEWIVQHGDPALGGRVRPLLGEETQVPLDDASVDLVTMINLHHELASPLATYREAFRILRPGGQLLVADWARGDTPKGPPQEIRVTAGQLTAMLRDAGFADVATHEGLPYHSLVTARKRA